MLFFNHGFRGFFSNRIAMQEVFSFDVAAGANTLRAINASFPLTLPSPSGRGRIVPGLVAKQSAGFAERALEKRGLPNGGSLSMNLKVGRVTPCAPLKITTRPNGAHGATRPTFRCRFKGSKHELFREILSPRERARVRETRHPSAFHPTS